MDRFTITGNGPGQRDDDHTVDVVRYTQDKSLPHFNGVDVIGNIKAIVCWFRGHLWSFFAGIKHYDGSKTWRWKCERCRRQVHSFDDSWHFSHGFKAEYEDSL